MKGKAYLALLALVMGHAAIGKLLGQVVMPNQMGMMGMMGMMGSGGVTTDDSEARYGLETMCIGGGQGLAAIFERVPA